jgi:signal recognition particle receptor subunit beta
MQNTVRWRFSIGSDTLAGDLGGIKLFGTPGQTKVMQI